MAASAEMGWHWLSSFNGILSMLSVAIIIVVMVALIRDWRQERNALPAAKVGPPQRTAGRLVADR